MSDRLKQDINIGRNLKLLRRRAKFTQDAASAKLEVMGIPMSSDIMAKMEQGRYSIRISVLLALKKIYHVESYDEFFSGLSLKSIYPRS